MTTRKILIEAEQVEVVRQRCQGNATIDKSD